jgi:hypothetical protein
VLNAWALTNAILLAKKNLLSLAMAVATPFIRLAVFIVPTSFTTLKRRAGLATTVKFASFVESHKLMRTLLFANTVMKVFITPALTHLLKNARKYGTVMTA